jgi:chromosome segregation ATPase
MQNFEDPKTNKGNGNDEKSKNNILDENATLWKKEKKARKDGIAMGVLIWVNSYVKHQRSENNAMLEDQKTVFTEQLTSRDSVINEWVLTFDQIEKDLATIKEKEKIINTASSDREFSKDKKQQVLKDIEYINTLLEKNKKKIASLSAQLNKSGLTIKSLETKVAELEASMAQRETEIADMKNTLAAKDFEINQLNGKMSDLQVAMIQKDDTINAQTREMNTAFVVTGTYKSLKEKGVLNKEGGFLGIGRKESLVKDFSDSTFAQIDITQTRTIPVNSKDAKLVTDHPSSSYEMIRDNSNKIAYIEIKNPEEFWKVTKYAVVEIKK